MQWLIWSHLKMPWEWFATPSGGKTTLLISRGEHFIGWCVCIVCTVCVDFSVRSLVRILKDMQRHVPGLQHLESWYIQMLVGWMCPVAGVNSLYYSWSTVQLCSDTFGWWRATLHSRWLQESVGTLISRIISTWINWHSWSMWSMLIT